MVEKASKQDEATAIQAHKDILHLRELHKEMDNAVLTAYGWTDIDLAHNFYDMDYLPENDRTRYTISPESRKGILQRLLQLNHELYAKEVAGSIKKPAKVVKRAGKRTSSKKQLSLLDLQMDHKNQELNLALTNMGYNELADDSWARVGPIRDEDFGITLASIIKILVKPMSIKWVRLAVMFTMEPRLLTPFLTNEDSSLWIRLVGKEAEPRSGNVQDFVPQATRGWGMAVKLLKGHNFIVEDLEAGTWAPGRKVEEAFNTGSWSDGRAKFILHFLTQRNINELIGDMPDMIQEWINAKAA